MQQDEFEGQGGSYLVNADGTRTRVEEPTVGAVRSRYVEARVDLAQILTCTAAEVIAGLPVFTLAQLAELAALEAAGKNRVTVLDAITSAQAQ